MNHNDAIQLDLKHKGVDILKTSTQIWLTPLLIITLCLIGHTFYNKFSPYLSNYIPISPQLNVIENCLNSIIIALCGYWIIIRIISKLVNILQQTPFFKNNSTIKIILPFFATILKTFNFLLFFNILSQKYLPSQIVYALGKLTSVLVIASIGWILFKFVDIAEQLLIQHFANIEGTIAERKIFTQALMLKRVAYSIIIVLTIGTILVLFDNVRALGASVLTTAGLVGLIITFTAQRSLSSIFSSLEIALTQTIKIGDSVVFNNEVGTIEQINIRSVVIKLWDWRRLIVPISHFLEKPFENWSHEQKTNLIGSVNLYADFTLPMPQMREKLKEILESTPLWDKNIGTIHVSDLQERVMQLNIQASARNPDDASLLRALIREKLIEYIVHTHPDSLPRNRAYTVKNNFEITPT